MGGGLDRFHLSRRGGYALRDMVGSADTEQSRAAWPAHIHHRAETTAMSSQRADTPVFPYGLPRERPDIPLSSAMERLYTRYSAPTYWWNQLYSQFRYTRLEGLEYNNGDGTLTRRDPSKVIKANGRYYVWYTRRSTGTPPRGAEGGTDVIPSTDWDLSDIWFATSEDGFVWEEQGVAVPRPPKPQPGWRSVSTPDVLVWEGRYYLYYQSFLEMSGTSHVDAGQPTGMSINGLS